MDREKIKEMVINAAEQILEIEKEIESIDEDTHLLCDMNIEDDEAKELGILLGDIFDIEIVDVKKQVRDIINDIHKIKVKEKQVEFSTEYEAEWDK